MTFDDLLQEAIRTAIVSATKPLITELALLKQEVALLKKDVPVVTEVVTPPVVAAPIQGAGFVNFLKGVHHSHVSGLPDKVGIVRNWDWPGMSMADMWTGAKFDYTKASNWANDVRSRGGKVWWCVGGIHPDHASIKFAGPYPAFPGYNASPKDQRILTQFTEGLVREVKPDFISCLNEIDAFGWIGGPLDHYVGDSLEDDRDRRLRRGFGDAQAVKAGCGNTPFMGPELVIWNDDKGLEDSVNNFYEKYNFKSLVDGIGIHLYDGVKRSFDRRVEVLKKYGPVYFTEVGQGNGRTISNPQNYLDWAKEAGGAGCILYAKEQDLRGFYGIA